MTSEPRRTRLATRLLRRLIWISLAVLFANIAFVAAYDAADRNALLSGVVDRQITDLETALRTAALPDLDMSGLVAPHFTAYPEAYAYVVLNQDGNTVAEMNSTLISPTLLQNPLFTEDWVVRKTTQSTLESYASHLVTRPEGTYRLYFAILTDPANLLGAEIRDEFFGHVWLPLLPTVILLIGAALLILRRDIGPITQAAAWARDITSDKTALPFDLDDDMPTEVADLTKAVNRAITGLNSELENEKRRAAEAAHALRTPVAVLVARMDEMPSGPAFDWLRADVQTLSRTVTQLLLSAGADRLTLAEGDTVILCDIAEDAVKKLAPWALMNGAEIIFDAQGVPQRVNGSSEAIGLALTNLIENAVHHGKSPIRVTVGPGASVSVADAGPGLPDADMDEIFAPFWRGHAAPKGGAGLGLAIVGRIQRAHHGQVKVSNSPDGGAVFKLTYIPTD